MYQLLKLTRMKVRPGTVLYINSQEEYYYIATSSIYDNKVDIDRYSSCSHELLWSYIKQDIRFLSLSRGGPTLNKGNS